MENKFNFGVARLSAIPVRKDPSHKAEQSTQLLFGEHYEVLKVESQNEWIYIRSFIDEYEGWVAASQHHEVTADYIQYLNQTELKITTDLTAGFLYNKIPGVILMGSIIPISSSELFKMDEQFAFNGEAKNLGMKRDAAFILSMARKYLNAPYQWGGRSPFGIDCSGLTQMVYRLSGYSLRRDAWQQARQGREINFDQCRPSDLAFFGNDAGEVIHTGIIADGGKIIHASAWVKSDLFTSEGIINAESNHLTHKLLTIRRILPD